MARPDQARAETAAGAPAGREPLSGTRVLAVLLAWFAAAVAVGAAGRLEAARPPLPQLLLLALTALTLLAWRATRLRAWVAAADLRLLVLVHLSRFVGVYFLVLHARGLLPYAFAVPGGWGDIAVAATALLLIVGVAPTTPRARWLYAAWNVAGLADILLVVLTAAGLAIAEPGSMRTLMQLPLSLLITFFVPLIVATHVMMLARLATAGRAPGGAR